MSFIVVYQSNEDCFIADSEEEIQYELDLHEWGLHECTVYELPKPIEFEIKLIRKTALVRKEK